MLDSWLVFPLHGDMSKEMAQLFSLFVPEIYLFGIANPFPEQVRTLYELNLITISYAIHGYTIHLTDLGRRCALRNTTQFGQEWEWCILIPLEYENV